MAASRARRNNAGANMANLIKDFHEEETFTTLYGGFNEEVNDNEFDLEEVSDDGSDVDFDEVDEDLEDDIQEGTQEEDESKRRKRKPVKTFLSIKRKNEKPTPVPAKKQKHSSNNSLVDYAESEEEEQTPSTSSGDREDSRDAIFASDLERSAKKKSKSSVPSGRSIRDSTAAKRFETEELEMVRAQRRQEIGPRKKVKHHVPTQEERLAKSKHTERKNRADLAQHERDEEANEKKKSRKIKSVRGPFVSCFISATQTAAKSEFPQNDEKSQLLFLTDDFEVPLLHDRSSDTYSRSLVCFQEDFFEETFAKWKKVKRLPDIRTCIVTGRPAPYKDPVTLQYYFDAAALQTLRSVIYRHFLANPIHLTNEKVMAYVQWYEDKYHVQRRGEHSQVGTYDYAMNDMKNASFNGDDAAGEEATLSVL